MKACIYCNKTKPLFEFEIHKECKGGYSNRCLECKRKQGREKYTPNKYLKAANKMSESWESYFKMLLRRKDRSQLSIELLINKLKEQNYRCALTGEFLTHRRVCGERPPTNVSIDRIIPGGEYTIDNIRLVCSIVNYMRLDRTDDVFIEWCNKVSKFAKSRLIEQSEVTEELIWVENEQMK